MDLQLLPSLAFWPASVSGLATASTLRLAGSVADVVGPRWVDLVGCFASGALMIGSGASRKGTELVALRALQGSRSCSPSCIVCCYNYPGDGPWSRTQPSIFLSWTQHASRILRWSCSWWCIGRYGRMESGMVHVWRSYTVLCWRGTMGTSKEPTGPRTCRYSPAYCESMSL